MTTAKELTVMISPTARADGGGIVSFVSWSRVEMALRSADIIRSNERVDKIKVDHHGIQLYFTTAPT